MNVFLCEMLKEYDLDSSPVFNMQKVSLRVGFEPTREDPIGFQVQRLNHSAIAAWWIAKRTPRLNI